MNQTDHTYQPLTLDQAKALRRGQIVYSLISYNRQAQPHHVKVNGAVKTWKRNPGMVQVPYKFGLYDYGYITDRNLHDFTLSERYALDNRK